jgi:uncharacterized protein YeaO (DUF488 family)
VVSADIERNIRLKRIYDPSSPDDGWRVLSMRYWPRGISRALVDEYTAKTAPSHELLHAFKHGGLSWEDYVVRYLEEMQSETARSEIERLAELAESRTITLLCGCEDESRCHRSLLRNLMIASVKQGAHT